MKKFVLAFAVFAAAGLPTIALAGEATAENASPVQMSDDEMDNVTAAGNAYGHATAPGQLKLQAGVLGHGKDFAPGQKKHELLGTLSVQGGGKQFAPGQIRKGL
jgi:hypothetical protein